MLILRGETVICNAKQRADGYFYADLLAGFSHCALLECLEEIQLAAHDAPVTRFGRTIPQSQQYTALGVHQQDADSNSGKAWLHHLHSS